MTAHVAALDHHGSGGFQLGLVSRHVVNLQRHDGAAFHAG